MPNNASAREIWNNAEQKGETNLSIKHLSFLHLGDVHYPELIETPPHADHKDKGMPPAVLHLIGSTRIREIRQGIRKIQSKEAEIVAILLTGDLTSRGDIDGYEACLKYLHEALDLSNVAHWENRSLIAVPGNHDVNRSAIVNGASYDQKFVPLEEMWEKIFGNRKHLTIGSPVPTDLGQTPSDRRSAKVRFIPLNTCYLCGEHRAFPAQIKDKLIELLDELKRTESVHAYESIMTEQVDCPAVPREHVGALSEHIKVNTANSLAVVLGHHPLFAQPTPRIEGYTELLNAGYIRDVVLETKKNVIYLHGHIHQDPILLVNSPVRGPHKIIHISAPALKDGFNLIRIHYSEKTGQPLSLEVVPYRLGDNLALDGGASVKIRLVDQSTLWNEIDDPWIEFILDELKNPKTRVRFRELVKATPSALSTGDTGSDSEFIEKALSTLNILELVVIDNIGLDCDLWQCRRTSV